MDCFIDYVNPQLNHSGKLTIPSTLFSLGEFAFALDMAPPTHRDVLRVHSRDDPLYWRRYEQRHHIYTQGAQLGAPPGSRLSIPEAIVLAATRLHHYDYAEQCKEDLARPGALAEIIQAQVKIEKVRNPELASLWFMNSYNNHIKPEIMPAIEESPAVQEPRKDRSKKERKSDKVAVKVRKPITSIK